jgi:hypothetical protein
VKFDVEMKSQEHLARFGNIACAAVPAVVSLLEGGYDLVGPRYGGPDIRGGAVPDWFQFMMEVARYRYGTVHAGGRDRGRIFGLGSGLVDARLASVGLTLDEITSPVKTPDVLKRIDSHSWLWGYSEERRSKFPSQRQRVDILTSQAMSRGLSGDSGQSVDVAGVGQRFGVVAQGFGFEIIRRGFKCSTLLYRPPYTGIGVYLGIKIETERRIPYPASVSFHIMPDVEFSKLDPWFAPSYGEGWLFTPLSLLGLGGFYTTGYDYATLSLCFDAHESFLKAILPVIVAVCDDEKPRA